MAGNTQIPYVILLYRKRSFCRLPHIAHPALRITGRTATPHLQVLADAGVVRDVGRERLWKLEPAQIEEAKRTLELIGGQWEAAPGKLKSIVESGD